MAQAAKLMVKTGKVSVPYPMPIAISEDKRERIMRWVVDQKYPMIKSRKMTHDSLQIVAYGPSLKDTWKEIDFDEPLITMSGALKFLLDNGVKPRLGKWFHAHVDPRPDNLDCVIPHPDVVYLLGSCSNPLIFKKLEGQKIAVWHAVSGPHTYQWVKDNHPGNILVAAGSTIGLASIHLGGVFGYYHFEVFGMDGSFKGKDRHSGHHGGIEHGQRPSALNPEYMTSRLMENANYETIAMLNNFPVICVFHGDGIIQDWVGKNKPHNAARHGTPEAQIMRKARFFQIDKNKALEMNMQGVPVLEAA
jgi:hypothetical protein